MNRLTALFIQTTRPGALLTIRAARRTSATDQNNRTTTYAYDDADRLVSVTDAANNVTQYAYDNENNLTSITDANNHVTSMTYDAYGRVNTTSLPSTLSEGYFYDAVGNLTSKTDRKNQTIQYVYDALNRLSSKTYLDSTTVDYYYDLASRVYQVNDPNGGYTISIYSHSRKNRDEWGSLVLMEIKISVKGGPAWPRPHFYRSTQHSGRHPYLKSSKCISRIGKLHATSDFVQVAL